MGDKPHIKAQKIDEWRWRIPREGKMRTEGLVFANESLLRDIQKDQGLVQVANVASLPGIVGKSMAMPDCHWGYGFPIGGVAAFDVSDGVVSPGGVGYDINCGVRLMRTGLDREAIQDKIPVLVDALFANIPSGVGSRRSDLKLIPKDLFKVLEKGVRWAVDEGFATTEDLHRIEAGGCIPGADPDLVGKRALERGRGQIGTLGSGNHFVEVGYVEEVFDDEAARAFGLEKNQVTVLVHTGSRGLGHQVCDDFLKKMMKASERYGIELPDRQLCAAPVESDEGRNYLSAMAAAANFAFVNRQLIAHWVNEVFTRILGIGPRDLRMSLVYDVCHNIARLETHEAGGKKRKLCVHRKGATRAFPKGHPDVPKPYRAVGQPVLIPGDMGRCSYVLVGTERAYEETFGSTCHGAGRMMSRGQAKKAAKGRSIPREMEELGIVVRGASRGTLVEEMPEAYKDVSDVVDIAHNAGISKKVARLKPMGVIKG